MPSTSASTACSRPEFLYIKNGQAVAELPQTFVRLFVIPEQSDWATNVVDVELEHHQEKSVTVTLNRAGQIRGHVRTLDGNPISGALVHCHVDLPRLPQHITGKWDRGTVRGVGLLESGASHESAEARRKRYERERKERSRARSPRSFSSSSLGYTAETFFDGSFTVEGIPEGCLVSVRAVLSKDEQEISGEVQVTAGSQVIITLPLLSEDLSEEAKGK